MKKVLKYSLLVFLVMMIFITGCKKKSYCEKNGHDFSNATCTEASKCYECGAIKEEAKGHKWVEATCESPKTCSVCGEEEGNVTEHIYNNDCDIDCNLCGEERIITHKWKDATCENPKTCSVCGKTEGSVLAHTYDNDCDSSCNVCGQTRNVSHSYVDATCVKPATCSVCGDTTGDALGHTWVDATYTAPKTCTSCGLTEGDPKPQPTNILVDSSKISIYIGETYDFNPQVLPLEVNQEVTYSLTKAEGGEGTISEDGIFEALHEGFVYIRISSKELSYISTTVTIEVLHPLIENDAYDAFNIMTGYGSDASTEVEINYHTHNIYTKVEYTVATDTEFNNFTDVTGVGYYFTEGTDKVTIPFPGRNVMRVSLKGLEPNTKYIYRINLGNDTYSEVYSFTTAKNDGSDSAFIILADTHYHAQTAEDGTFKSHGSEMSETLINNILLHNDNVNFVVSAGDIVDTGGNANTWSVFFEHSKSLKYMARLGVPGNHEYYITGTGQSDGRYQKAHFATPFNGPSTQIGLSGYVVYNDILIILVDNEGAAGRTELMEWMDDILENVEYTYSIAVMHTPIYYEEHETSNKDRDEKMMDLFDKHSVDLVVAGHYHGHRVRSNYYDGKTSTDSGLGVNYMTASFSGVKSRSDTSLASGYLVETSNGVITLKHIDENGTLLHTYTFANKKGKESVPETKENLLNSLTGTYNEETQEYIISMSNKFYGNVKKLEVEELLRGEIKGDMVFPTSSYNTYKIANILPNYQYNFKLTIHFNDGTTEVKYMSIDLSKPINLKVSTVTQDSISLSFDPSSDDMLYSIKEYIVYVNGEEYSRFDYIDYYDNPVTSYVLKGLSSNTTYEITLVAKDYYDKKLYQHSVSATTK